MACATLKRSYDFDPVLSPQQQPCNKRRRYMTLKSTSQAEPSKFLDVTPTMTSEQIAQNVEQEWRRLQKRKRLMAISPTSTTSSFLETHAASLQCSSVLSASTSHNNKPLFTLKQVQLICERMLKERETELREEYDKVLNTKLAEQYDAFVKFSYDQVQRRLGEVPLSYVS